MLLWIKRHTTTLNKYPFLSIIAAYDFENEARISIKEINFQAAAIFILRHQKRAFTQTGLYYWPLSPYFERRESRNQSKI